MSGWVTLFAGPLQGVLQQEMLPDTRGPPESQGSHWLPGRGKDGPLSERLLQRISEASAFKFHGIAVGTTCFDALKQETCIFDK